jgi:membrane peptidoglycan carboxypeptidase
LEAASITGRIKAPNHYSPYVDEKACQIRRNSVLAAMQRKAWISDAKLKLLVLIRTTGNLITTLPRHGWKKENFRKQKDSTILPKLTCKMTSSG